MTQETYRIVVVSAGVSNPSSTSMLADRTAQRAVALARAHGHDVEISVVELRELLPELPQALSTQFMGPGFRRAIDLLAEADGVIAATPVYKAGASAAFSGFFQVLDNDLLIGKPAVLAATAGTSRHALVIDQEVRGMFAYLRALPVPTSLFAAPEDMNDPALGSRIDRAAQELVLLMESGFARAVRGETWDTYSHEFGSDAGREVTVDFSSAVMKLAAGGTLPSQTSRNRDKPTTPR
ncbi:NAD(P)H-dependent oxidoreductase [Demequina sp. B12]|uniref:CE1759 family FMN reductase n=1 Tax=Demequina sp. B12 TaxID=2992757 RepID=UPI00237A5807|nr:CE1759 family FMN reductase [Demequina sp. B12]MDE0572806.1 NAD(P)H-dependent oxidoreductase [Demequina sp. B12]